MRFGARERIAVTGQRSPWDIAYSFQLGIEKKTDAKRFWSALCHSLTFMNAGDYEDRRSSIHELPARCEGLTTESK
jgi:hypothetical protein